MASRLKETPIDLDGLMNHLPWTCVLCHAVPTVTTPPLGPQIVLTFAFPLRRTFQVGRQNGGGEGQGRAVCRVP